MRLLLTAALLSALSAPLVAQEPVHLLYSSSYSPGHPFSQADRVWMDYIERESGGTLVVDPVWSGSLLSDENSMLELRHGVADVGLITPIYAKGGAHLTRVQTGFYSGISSVEGQIDLYRCLLQNSRQLQAEIEGLKLLAVQGGALLGVITRSTPINGLDDLQGLRLRAPTEMLSVLETMGADPVSMPMREVYSSLAKGVLDGLVAPVDTFKSLHFAEVASHYSLLVVPRGAYPSRAMKERRWNELSQEHQAILEASIPIWEAALTEKISIATDEGMQVAVQSNVDIRPVSAADQETFDQIYLQQARMNAQKLDEYGIDGQSVLDLALSSINSDGSVNCAGGA